MRENTPPPASGDGVPSVRPRSGARRRTRVLPIGVATIAALACAAVVFTLSTPASAAPLSPSAASTPNLVTGVAYLVDPANLVDGDYYEAFPGYADFGLTIDGAFALAATGTDNSALAQIVDFDNSLGSDPSDQTIDVWTGVGTPYVSGGAVGKEALLAEVVGRNPESFGGENLIADLDSEICTQASDPSDATICVGAGNYDNSDSTFDQALGIIAQLRAGDDANAAAPISFLLSQQESNGAWPSLIPSTGDSDVDSTAMAVMALQLAPGATAAAAEQKGITWIASQQAADGGFPGVATDSINSAALAIQALALDKSTYTGQTAKALAFLAAEQNSDGGFNADADGQQGSDIRASTQAVGGSVGTSFATLEDDLSATSAPTPTPTKTPTKAPTSAPTKTKTTSPAPVSTHSASGTDDNSNPVSPVIAAAPGSEPLASSVPSSQALVTSSSAPAYSVPSASPVTTRAATTKSQPAASSSSSSKIPLFIGLSILIVLLIAAATGFLIRRQRRTTGGGS
jgi:prenyltransferase beta subunit